VNGFRYKLIIATDPFAMRGFDYRGKDIGITLLLAKSFAFEREAIQGLNRVGRFGDQCKRIMLASVPLIDETQARVYSSFLTSFMIARHALDIEIRRGNRKLSRISWPSRSWRRSSNKNRRCFIRTISRLS
jgi:hypothetical protein